MDIARWKKIDELIDAALEIPESEREAFVHARAGDDAKLRDEVLHLLKAQRDGDDFLLKSAMNVAAKAMAADDAGFHKFRFLNKKIDTYRIDRLIGAGGMGEVYLAFDEKLQRKVALKILPAEFTSNDERVKRFETEARVISSLNHPNIVTIYDAGEEHDLGYIAMELIEGTSLKHWSRKPNLMPVSEVLLTVATVADALDYAHQQGVVHRDIKPANVMLTKDRIVKVMDFGIAKMASSSQTQTNMVLGTPTYMSPEQIAG